MNVGREREVSFVFLHKNKTAGAQEKHTPHLFDRAPPFHKDLRARLHFARGLLRRPHSFVVLGGYMM
jgi:hypothetical protein